MPRWYLSFHGGDDAHDWNNIHAFDLAGHRLGKMLITDGLPHDIRLRELRGFCRGPDGDLYVANAWRNASQVLRFHGAVGKDGRHAFRDVFCSLHERNPSLSHPFDVTFGPDTNLFVPSQDTNLVGRYFGPIAQPGSPGAPMPLPEALRGEQDETLLPGTFVPTHGKRRRGVVAVRGTHFDEDGQLFVADRDDGSVKCFHGASGAWIRDYRHEHLSRPIHLLPVGQHRLLVGSGNNNAILVLHTDTGEFRTLIKPGAGGLDGPAGMAVGPDGRLYVCSRLSRQVLSFDVETGKPDRHPFIDGLPDNPEFIRLVDL